MKIMDHVDTTVETSRWGWDPDDVRLTEAWIRFGELTPVVIVSADRTPVLAPESPFKVACDDDGSFVVSDRYDDVAGVGSTLQEAQHDFVVNLTQQISYLRSNQGRLHPRLQESQRRLERAFPWA